MTPSTAPNPMNPPACEAKTRAGSPCQRRPSPGRRRCNLHGGKSLVGPASPGWKDGRRSRYLPARFLDQYHAALHAPDQLSLADDLVVLESRLCDALGRTDRGEAGAIWTAVRRSWGRLNAARRSGNVEAMNTALWALGDAIDAGYQDTLAWEEVRRIIQERAALIREERRRLIDEQRYITVESAAGLLFALVDSVRLHVTDDAALRAVTSDFARLTGLPDPFPAAAVDEGFAA